MCVEDDIAANCAEACRHFAECGQALCSGLQGVSDWEIEVSDIGMRTECEVACTETPELLDLTCAHTTCNETLTLVVNTQDGFEEFCAEGFDTLFVNARAAASAPDSMVSGIFGVISESAEVLDILSTEGPMTVFLPIDSALDMLDPEVLNLILNDPVERDQVLNYHIIDEGLPSTGIAHAIREGQDYVDTIGGRVSLEMDDNGNIYIGGAMVILTDIFSSNGVIHLIDNVIEPLP
jgi:uncharacterized surface protein with fasciclin (FAS1) repeats